MVRNIKYDHNIVVTGTDDATKQVSKDAWNDGHDETGMFGHGTVTTLTIATGAIIPVNSMHIVDGEGAANDDLDNLTITETSDRDELWLIKGAQIITVRDNSVSSGNIFLLNGSTLVLDANKPMRLIRSGVNWYEFSGAGSGIFLDSNFLIQDDGDVSKEWDTQLSGATTSTKTTLAFSQTLNRTITYPDATDTLVGKATTDVFTNKTFDANGVGNSITNIENADLASGVFSNITGLGAQSQALDMNTQILQFVDANQTITNNAGNLLYDVAAGQVHLFRVNNVTEMQLSATALAMQGNSVLQVGFLTSFAADPSDAGTIRLGNAQSIDWRNAGNTANFGITGNASDQIAIDADFNIQGNKIINTGTLTLPTITDTLVGRATIDTFIGAKTFQDDKLLIQNPAATFAYTLTAGAVAANRILNLPLITATDTLAVLGLAQTFTELQTFENDAFKLLPTAGDAPTPANGQMWYNSTTDKLRAQENGASVDMIGGGGGVWTKSQASASGSSSILDVAVGSKKEYIVYVYYKDASGIAGQDGILRINNNSGVNYDFGIVEEGVRREVVGSSGWGFGTTIGANSSAWAIFHIKRVAGKAVFASWQTFFENGDKDNIGSGIFNVDGAITSITVFDSKGNLDATTELTIFESDA